ncbi:MAG: YqiA/YcfP family alpha/beta fold hydrolase [bacterium]
MRCIFAHGFEGVPQGRKFHYLREALGLEVEAPFLPRKGFSLEDQVGVLLEAIDADLTLRLAVGSSMGALALAVAASRRPHRDLRLVLLAPAVGLHDVWATQLGADGMALWQEMGQLQYRHQGVGQEVGLPYALWTQCRDAADVAVTHPVVILHGLTDDVIPVENALALARRSPGIRRFVAAPDGHRLLDSLPLLGEATRLVLAD